MEKSASKEFETLIKGEGYSDDYLFRGPRLWEEDRLH